MGCDIHAVWQKQRPTGAWEDVESKYKEDRDYELFAVLADVRNRDGATPIAEPRGFPKDFPIDGDKYHNEWMGDHSFSWFLGSELLEWYKTAPVLTRTAIIERETYEKWDKISGPYPRSQDVFGARVVKIDDTLEGRTENPGWTHIRVQWPAYPNQEFTYFFDEVKRLMDLHGEIRFVFGFDN
jgi:hypothetical protein